MVGAGDESLRQRLRVVRAEVRDGRRSHDTILLPSSLRCCNLGNGNGRGNPKHQAVLRFHSTESASLNRTPSQVVVNKENIELKTAVSSLRR